MATNAYRLVFACKKIILRLSIITILLITNSASVFANTALDSNLVKSFIIRSQITLLNKKPQKEDIENILPRFYLAKNITLEKEKYVNELMGNKAFADNLFEIYNNEYLQGLDNAYIRTEYFVYKAYLSYPSTPEQMDIITKIVTKLLNLKDAGEDYKLKKIAITELQKRFMDNRFYDNKNMGSDNLVSSTYKYLFSRNPTKYELAEGKKMVENNNAVLLNKKGSSTDDYFAILFGSDEYKEGQVNYWYTKLVYRKPTIDEVLKYAYASKFKVEELITQIIISKEYAKF